MSKVYKVPIKEEICNYLERLSYEVGTKEGVVARIVTTATTDDVFTQTPYQTFMKELEGAHIAYDKAKNELTESLKPVIEGKEGVGAQWSWSIPDFSKKEVVITVMETGQASCKACNCTEAAPELTESVAVFGGEIHPAENEE